MTQGHLRVTVVEAAKLVDKNFNDSYVEIYLEEADKQKTRTINNDERPKWNETFDFDLSSNHDYLYINVYDRDEEKKADFIGSTKIHLDKVMEKGYVDDWVQLRGIRRDIHLRMSFEKESTV